MNSTTILTSLGRVKAHCARNESMRALEIFLQALRGAVSLPSIPINIKGALREALQALSADPLFKKYFPHGLQYQPGSERDIYADVLKVYKGLVAAQNAEPIDEIRKRKLQLDDFLGDGMAFLKEGKITEADEQFTNAVNCVKDEVRLFALIGKALLEAGEVRRALSYFRQGLALSPADTEMHLLFAETTKRRDNL